MSHCCWAYVVTIVLKDCSSFIFIFTSEAEGATVIQNVENYVHCVMGVMSNMTQIISSTTVRLSDYMFITYHHCCAVHMGSWMSGYGNMMNEPTGSGKLLLSYKIMTLYDRPIIRQKCCGNHIFFMLHLSGDETQFLEIWSSIREVETRMLICKCIVLENC